MAREIPEVVRAAAGLAATVLDEARRLPETLPGLPVRVIGLAMQTMMKVQQHYAGLVARGDELFTGVRGEDEPGLATFDDEEPGATPGFRDSAFDRASATMTEDELIDDELDELSEEQDTDEVVAVVAEPVDQIDVARDTIEEVIEEAPSTEEVLEELAIDELVGEAAATGDAATVEAALEEAALEEAALEELAREEEAESLIEVRPEPAPEPVEEATATVDVLTPDGEIATVEGTVTDEGVAAVEEPEAEEPETREPAAGQAEAEHAGRAPVTEAEGAATATDESGTPVAAAEPAPTADTGTDTPATDTPATDALTTDTPATDALTTETTAPPEAPVEGYDSFSIAQLRGHLRGYALATVQELLDYEQATLAREPYLRMLRNRLERLQADNT